MDATAWVGIAGIVGTLAAAIFAPIVGESVRRKGARQERLLEQRLETYAELLRVCIQFVDNTVDQATFPQADFADPDAEELTRLDGRMRLVASKNVAKHYKTFSQQLVKFRADLGMASLNHRANRNSGDSASLIKQRMALGDKAEAIRNTYYELEAAIRKDVQS